MKKEISFVELIIVTHYRGRGNHPARVMGKFVDPEIKYEMNQELIEGKRFENLYSIRRSKGRRSLKMSIRER